MKKSFVRITTVDTKKTYEFPGENIPQVWEVTLAMEHVDKNGCVSTTSFRSADCTIYLERETLESAKLLPMDKTKEPDREPTETPEDLLLRLLEHIGVYPTE